MTTAGASGGSSGRRPHHPGRHLLVLAGMSAVTVAVFTLAMVAHLPG